MLIVLMIVAVLSLFLACAAFWRAFRDHYWLRGEIFNLEKQLHLAQSHLKRRSYLASEIAHDIKNPLTAILCSAEALELTIGKDLDPVNQRSLTYIREYGDHLLRLLNDFLDINRVQSGNLESKKEEVNVTRVIESVVGLLAAYAERQQVTLEVMVLTKLQPAWMDPAHLKQILFNLTHNAIKFSGQSSTVSIIIQLREEDSEISIEVRDNGAGIPESRLSSIFDPYAQYQDNCDERDSGQGLGLALCRALADLEACTLTVASEVGKGSVFTLITPSITFEEYDQSQPQVLIGPGEIATPTIQRDDKVLAGQRILVVDDNIGARESVSRLIETWGAIVDCAQEVEQILHAIDQCHYDAIVVDDSEGRRDATHLAQLIRENLDSNSTKIILSQTRPTEIIGMDPEERVVDTVVEKPLNGRKILGALLSSEIH